jgi:hypothetical protein
MAWIAQHGEIDDVVILDAACAIILNLFQLRAVQPTCEVRKLHTLVDLPQGTVLKAMRHLTQAGVLNSVETAHDPLGSFVSLPDSVAAKLADLGVTI